MGISVDPDWWKTLFDELYLLTDARSVCDDALTRREVDVVCDLLPVRPGHRILDLCGGHGRHSLELCARGFHRITLLDYSEALVDHCRARARERGHRIDCVRADARSTDLSSGQFDHVLILGNSLGYAPEPESDRRILSEALRVLRPGGWLFADVTDGASIRSGFAPSAQHAVGDDLTVWRDREIDRDAVRVRERVVHREQGVVRDRSYAVRLYEPGPLAEALRSTGFSNVTVRTGYSLHGRAGDFGFMNHRMIATAQKMSAFDTTSAMTPAR